MTIRTIETRSSFWPIPERDKMQVLVLVDNPQDAYVVADALKIKQVNVGNFNKKRTRRKLS